MTIATPFQQNLPETRLLIRERAASQSKRETSLDLRRDARSAMSEVAAARILEHHGRRPLRPGFSPTNVRPGRVPAPVTGSARWKARRCPRHAQLPRLVLVSMKTTRC